MIFAAIVELQCSSIWKQKFIDLRVQLETMKRDRLSTVTEQTAENEVLSVWNTLLETFGVLEEVGLASLAKAILSTFSLSYPCDVLFSTLYEL